MLTLGVSDDDVALVRKAVLGMMAMHRMQDGLGQAQAAKDYDEKANHVRQELEGYKKEAETVRLWLAGRGGAFHRILC